MGDTKDWTKPAGKPPTQPRTVGELIRELEQYPPDLTVKVMVFDADYDRSGQLIAVDNLRAMPIQDMHDAFIGDGEKNFLSIEAAGNDVNL
jgi:hypothetical protein